MYTLYLFLVLLDIGGDYGLDELEVGWLNLSEGRGHQAKRLLDRHLRVGVLRGHRVKERLDHAHILVDQTWQLQTL